MACTTTATTTPFISVSPSLHLSYPFPLSNPAEPKHRNTISFLPHSQSSHVAAPPPPPPPRLILTPHSQHTSPLESQNDSPIPSPPHFLHILSLLKLATRHKSIHLLSAVHALHAKLSHQMDDPTRLTNHLISVYISFGLLSDAQKVLDEMPLPNVVSFSLLMSAYAKQQRNGGGFRCGTRSQSAVRLFHIMRKMCIQPNCFSLVALLTDSMRRQNPLLGREVHALAIKSCLDSSIHVSNALLGVYAKCGGTDVMMQLFEEMGERDIFSWNTVMLGLTEGSRYDEALDKFREMQMSGISGDHYSISTVLTALTEGQCSAFGGGGGGAIHAYAIKSGLELDMVVSTALLGFYMKHGSVDDMLDLFERMSIKDTSAWNSMLNGLLQFGNLDSAMDMFDKMPKRDFFTYNSLLSGFSKNGEGERGLDLFVQMINHGMPINDFTLTRCMDLCAIVGDGKKSEQIHGFVIKCGCKASAWIDSALIDMCAKCGRTRDAHEMFEKWPHGAEMFTEAWNNVLSSLQREGRPEETLKLFLLRWKEGESSASFYLSEFVMTTTIGECGVLGFTDMGKQMHALTTKSGLACNDLYVRNSLISMYARCGDLKHARKMFDEMRWHDQVSWNALMRAHLLNWQGDTVLALWSQMKKLALKPDPFTFVLLITACRHTTRNSVDTCHEIFLSMQTAYNIRPRSEHYAAMIEVLGFWEHFDQVEELLNNMPLKPDASIWRSLLNICQLKSNPGLEKYAMQNLLALEPKNESEYILASNLYASSSRWYCSEKLREEMRGKGMRKRPVRSWFVHANMVHPFYSRDNTHPSSKDVYRGLDVLILECMKNGYEPDTSCVLHEVEEYQKKHFLLYHSAKLAVMYGILLAKPGVLVQVMKNVRLCRDCHSFLKHASVLTGRHVSLRDTTGFHVFRNGECSCGDSW